MNKFIKVVLNAIAITVIATTVYRVYLNDLNSEIKVACAYEYSASINVMEIICDVEDSKSIISIDYPLTLSIFDDGEIIFLQSLVNGENTISIDSLDYNTSYQISIDGFNFVQKEYVSTIFVEHLFSTVSEGTEIPSFEIIDLEHTDLTCGFSIDLIDNDNIVKKISVQLFSGNYALIQTINIIDMTDLDIYYENLQSLSSYNIKITLEYYINDLHATALITDYTSFTTSRTLLLPTATISNLTNDNVFLTFSLTIDSEDATNVTYYVELISPLGTVLATKPVSTFNLTFDVSHINGDYKISVKANYVFKGIQYSGDEIVTYNIYNYLYSNFFIIPSLSKVDTSIHLTSYDDYDDYIYTFLDDGKKEFTIYCDEPLDCSEFVENTLYSRIPFTVSNLLHPYSNVRLISYSYNSSQVTVTLTFGYTEEEITQINQAVNTILNIIIVDGMTTEEKVLAVHNYIVLNTIYDTACLDDPVTCDNDHSALGVLFDSNAVCEGYAHTMDIMLRALRIPSVRLSSLTHQWNVVNFDGLWYHVDATWDDPVTHNGANLLKFDYFKITSLELDALDSSTSHDFTNPYIDFVE